MEFGEFGVRGTGTSTHFRWYGLLFEPLWGSGTARSEPKIPPCEKQIFISLILNHFEVPNRESLPPDPYPGSNTRLMRSKRLTPREASLTAHFEGRVTSRAESCPISKTGQIDIQAVPARWREFRKL